MTKLSSSFTIVDSENLRGILAPAKTLSRQFLNDIIDFIELSYPKEIKRTEARIKEADKNNSWVSFEKVLTKAQKTK